jgi:unsaturated chondroitin disaccharide hydrolase
VADNSLFIDIMMNVGIIFYAARETGDRRLRDVALRHSPDHAARAGARRRIHRARRNFRHRYRRISAADHAPGLSRRFLLVARPGVGAVRIQHCYEYSRDPHFLETAEVCADYYITHSNPTAFRRGISTRRRRAATLLDTSSAAIAASGLLRLCRLLRIDEGPSLLVDRGADSAVVVRESIWRSPIRSGKGYSRAACIICIRDWAWMNR